MRLTEARTLTLMIWSGAILSTLNLLTAFLFDGMAAFLAAMGVYMAVRVEQLVEERRAALAQSVEKK